LLDLKFFIPKQLTLAKEFYTSLAGLGEAITFVDQASAATQFDEVGKFALEVGKHAAKLELIGKVAPDVAEYWNKRDSKFRVAVRERIRTAICAVLDRDDDVLLLSHGSGCIATYDVLWQLSHDKRWRKRYAEKKIDTWVTMGSPLADTTVRRRVLGADASERERFPTNIVTWHNMSAEDDYLCHDNTCADDYNLMLKQRQVSSIRDYRVYNLAVRYGKSNPHSSLGYLVHPRMTLIVTDWLSRTSSA